MGKEVWELIMYLQTPLVTDLWVGNFAVKKSLFMFSVIWCKL